VENMLFRKKNKTIQKKNIYIYIIIGIRGADRGRACNGIRGADRGRACKEGILFFQPLLQ
jgi:hypothetical protein